jgi:hypothetical protein
MNTNQTKLGSIEADEKFEKLAQQVGVRLAPALSCPQCSLPWTVTVNNVDKLRKDIDAFDKTMKIAPDLKMFSTYDGQFVSLSTFQAKALKKEPSVICYVQNKQQYQAMFTEKPQVVNFLLVNQDEETSQGQECITLGAGGLGLMYLQPTNIMNHLGPENFKTAYGDDVIDELGPLEEELNIPLPDLAEQYIVDQQGGVLDHLHPVLPDELTVTSMKEMFGQPVSETELEGIRHFQVAFGLKGGSPAKREKKPRESLVDNFVIEKMLEDEFKDKACGTLMVHANDMNTVFESRFNYVPGWTATMKKFTRYRVTNSKIVVNVSNGSANAIHFAVAPSSARRIIENKIDYENLLSSTESLSLFVGPGKIGTLNMSYGGFPKHDKKSQSWGGSCYNSMICSPSRVVYWCIALFSPFGPCPPGVTFSVRLVNKVEQYEPLTYTGGLPDIPKWAEKLMREQDEENVPSSIARAQYARGVSQRYHNSVCQQIIEIEENMRIKKVELHRLNDIDDKHVQAVVDIHNRMAAAALSGVKAKIAKEDLDSALERPSYSDRIRILSKELDGLEVVYTALLQLRAESLAQMLEAEEHYNNACTSVDVD